MSVFRQININCQFLHNVAAKHVGKRFPLWRRMAVVLLSWLLFLVLIICYPAEHWQGGSMEQPGEGPLSPDVAANHIGSFAYVALDPEKDYRPLHSIRFDKFLTESGQFGFFKTGVYRTARITGLRLRLYSYLADGEIQSGDNRHPDVQNTNLADDEIQSGDNRHPDVQNTNHKDILATIQALIRKNTVSSQDDLTACSTSTDVRIYVSNVDLSNIGEVKVRDFGYEFFANGDKIVSIKSVLAHLSYAMEDIILRGHVTISNVDGDTLEGNHVCWNSRTERFRVKGGYVLKRRGNKFFGKDILVDMNLNEIYAQQANLDNKEGDKCSRM